MSSVQDYYKEKAKQSKLDAERLRNQLNMLDRILKEEPYEAMAIRDKIMDIQKRLDQIKKEWDI